VADDNLTSDDNLTTGEYWSEEPSDAVDGQCSYISRESLTTQNVYWSRASVSVCLFAAASPHYYSDPDVTWGNGKGTV